MGKFDGADNVGEVDKHALKSTPVRYGAAPGGRPKKAPDEKAKGVMIYFAPDDLTRLESIAAAEGMTVQLLLKTMARKRIWENKTE